MSDLMTRRNALKGGFVLAATAHAATFTPDILDPILIALRDYRNETERFIASKEEEWPAYGGEGAFIEMTYGPPRRVLDTWVRPAETKQGAIAALKFALEEAEQYSASDSIATMLAAALAFFETQA